MFKKIDVIFQVEHVDRELESYKAVAKNIKEKYGMTSLIISNMFHSYYLFFYKPKIVIWNNLQQNISGLNGFMWATYGENIKYISHRWEQLLFPYKFKLVAPKNNFEKNEVIFFTWYDEFKNYLINHGVKENNVKVVGSIANNILCKLNNNQKHFRNKLSKEFKISEKKEWLFLPMNFLWAYKSDEEIKKLIKNGYDKNIAYEYKEYSTMCLEKYIYFIDYISKNYDFEIILRPHLTITEQHYIDKFINLLGYIPKNVIINKAYSIREWIVGSDIIGSNWSTAVWDANHIGKKSFYFTPFERPEWFDTYWARKVVNLKDIEDFNNFYKQNLNADKNLISNDSIDKFSKVLNDLSHIDYTKLKKIKISFLSNVIKYLIKNMLCKYFNFIFIQKWQTYDWFDVIKIDK